MVKALQAICGDAKLLMPVSESPSELYDTFEEAWKIIMQRDDEIIESHCDACDAYFKSAAFFADIKNDNWNKTATDIVSRQADISTASKAACVAANMAANDAVTAEEFDAYYARN